MSKEKRIEEIRRDIFAAFGGYAKWEEDWQSLAEAVYNAGYRKQIEAEWKEDIVAFCNVCSACKARVDRYAIKGNGGKLNFCPNCGAKMEGGAE